MSERSLAPGGGGGGHFHICAYWVCATRETSIFSPKFPLQSISFLQMTNNKKICSGDHHFQLFFFLQAILSPPTASLLQPAQTICVWAVPRGYSWPECQPDTSYKVGSTDPHFHARARSGVLHFKLDSLQSPLFFTLPWHIPTKIWGEWPPPPPPPPGF